MDIFISYSGFDFLIFYCMMLVTCVLAGLWIPAVMRPEGRRGAVEDEQEIAVLAGGVQRHADTIVSALFAKDALGSAARGQLNVTRRDVEGNAAERALLVKTGTFKLSEARKTLETHAKRAEAQLMKRGLLMESGESWRLRGLSILPYAALFAIGLYRQQAGAAIGEPTGFLAALLCLTILFAVIRLSNYSLRTKAGNEALRDIEQKSSRLKRAPMANEAGYAVAIFGTAVLVGTPWEPLHAMRQSSGDGGTSSGSDSDSGGDSGCGGGGCGGCGG